MGVVLAPFGNLLNPGINQVPMGALAIDWTNSLTNGLIGCWVPGATGPINLCGRDPFYLGSANGAGNVVATDTSAATPEGPGLNSPTGTRQTWIAVAPTDFKAPTSKTSSLYWRGLPIANGNDFSVLIGVTYDNNNGNPFAVYDMVINSVGWSTGINLGWNVGGSPSNNGTVQVIPTGTMCGLGATYNQNPSGRGKMFVNGAKKIDVAFGGVANTSATSSVVIGGQPQAAGPAAIGGTTNLALFWMRELAEAEMTALDSDPYQFLIPAEGEMSGLFFAPPPTSPISIGQTIFRPRLVEGWRWHHKRNRPRILRADGGDGPWQ